jgi:hypothetical protein
MMMVLGPPSRFAYLYLVLALVASRHPFYL